MFHLKTLCFSATVALLLAHGPVRSLSAQDDHDHGHAHEHEGHDHAEVIAFQLADWHEQHFDDAQKAAQHFKAIQKLGCEVKQDNHDGHTDVI